MKFIVFFFFATLQFLSIGQRTDAQNELLWEISGNGLKAKSYIFGSLHSNDKRLFQFSDSTYFAMNAVQGIVLETDVFSLFDRLDTRKEEITLLYDSNGNPYTGTDRPSKTLYGDEDGMPQFLDAYFQEYCFNANKKFFPLEKVEDQLNLLSNIYISDDQEINFIANQIIQDKLLNLYLSGNIQALDKAMKISLAAYPGSYDKIIVDRNLNMSKKLDSLVKTNSVLCVVGAGHLSGDRGLIQLLRNKGYRLRKVQATFADENPSYKTEVKAQKSYLFTDEKTGLFAKFPGKPLLETREDGSLSLTYRDLGQGNSYLVELLPLDNSTSLVDQAETYIASPDASPAKYVLTDDGFEYFQGISDSYPEGIKWVRVSRNENYLLVIKVYGGNKFMNSNRPELFFNKVWIE
ncbi:MAG: TraB/GumN family protein [Bacteroidota bacterium]